MLSMIDLIFGVPKKCQVERERNFEFLKRFLANFAGDLPTKPECEVPLQWFVSFKV